VERLQLSGLWDGKETRFRKTSKGLFIQTTPTDHSVLQPLEVLHHPAQGEMVFAAESMMGN